MIKYPLSDPGKRDGEWMKGKGDILLVRSIKFKLHLKHDVSLTLPFKIELCERYKQFLLYIYPHFSL